MNHESAILKNKRISRYMLVTLKIAAIRTKELNDLSLI